ncbi:MAG: G5 domain-containing protein [Clostridia bacterium]|nr:G5 domain-containing protein [Clostridia bacterium]
MRKDDKASVSLKKILILSLIVIFSFSAAAFATNNKIKTVTIEYSNGEEVNIITSKQIVSAILEENGIILLPEEYIYPNLDEELGDRNSIIISTEEIKYQEIAQAEEERKIEELLEEYTPVVEKIEVVQEEIPYETITKDISEGAANTENEVITPGVNGIKEVTYRVKYKNDIEIEREELSSVVIKEPVTKVVQVQVKSLSRYGSRTSAVSYGNGKWSYSDSDLDLLCAITAQECCSSYEGALAVITTACNRTVSSSWKSRGSDPLSQYKAKGQFCYSIDNHWRKRLNGNYPSYVKQAVLDALNGKRNHTYLSFRSAGSGVSGVNIGGNVYFNSL